MKIAVADIGYVGISNAVLLAQYNGVIEANLSEDRVAGLNARQSPIIDPELEEYLAEKPLDLTATMDGDAAYADADFVVVATPTNYDPLANDFDTSSVEAVFGVTRE